MEFGIGRAQRPGAPAHLLVQTMGDQPSGAFEELEIFVAERIQRSLSASSIPRMCRWSLRIGTMISERVV